MRLHVASLRTAALAAVSTLVLAVPASHATMIEGDSGGVISTIDLSIASLITASSTIGQLDEASPPPYDGDTTVLDLDFDASISLGVGQDLHLAAQDGTGIVMADSDVDGITTTPRTVSGQATIEDLQFNAASLSGVVTLAPIISVTSGNGALALDSFASVVGNSSGVTVTGDSDLAGLSISVLGTALDLSPTGLNVIVAGDAAPNTVILPVTLGIAGLTVTLNEQINIGDNITTFGTRVSAVHINFDDVDIGALGLGLINGDVYLAQAYALGTIPEPSAFSVLALSAVMLGLRRRRN